MRYTFATISTLALCACGPKSKFQDYTTPERAARSYIEAGRVGDDAAMRRSVVAAERDLEQRADYEDLADYSLQLDRLIDDQRAVVLLVTGPLQTPIACQKEGGEWKVSIQGTLACMQQMLSTQLAQAPR